MLSSLLGKDVPASCLLRLPAEIRSLIFEFAVTSDKTVVTFRLDDYQRDSYIQAIQPPLTYVSRQVRSESLPIWYESNNFVIHTESPKLEDAQRWLRCNADHLEIVRRISLWIRYVPFIHHRGSSQGAIQVSISRPRKYDPWTVDNDWAWVTVLRKPSELEDDAKGIIEKLNDMISEFSSPEEYYNALTDLRSIYVATKIP